MKKKIIGSLLLIFSVFVLSGCGGKEEKADNSSKAVNNTSGVKSSAESVCTVFTKESIASVTGADIVSVDTYSAEGLENYNCRYYIRSKRYAPILSIGQYMGSAEVEKKKYEDEKSFKGWKTVTDKQITMDNFITYNEGGKMNDIFLIKGKNEYYRISLYSLNVIKDEQMINLASQVAQKISEKK